MRISGYDHGVHEAAGIRAHVFKRIDQDGSGGISKVEFQKRIAERAPHGGPHGGGPSLDDLFAHIDSNRDGLIDQTENDAFLQSVHAPRRGPQNPSVLAKKLFAKADADEDGGLTKAELLGALPTHGTASLLEDFFKSADSDNDGKISKAELEEALRKMLQPPTSYTPNGDVQRARTGGGTFSAIA